MNGSVAWAAPGRVNLIGEHTDYNDGYVLPFALPLRTVVSCSSASDPQWTVTSSSFGTASFSSLSPGTPAGWASYVAGVVWALQDAGYPVPYADMTVSSDIPTGAGLSSSAALECAVLGALSDLGDLSVPVDDRPRLAQRAENAYVGVPCGIMDQSASTLCRAGHALFLDCRTLDVEHIPFDLASAGLAILVVDTRAPHKLVTGEYAARRSSCAEAASALGVPSLRDASLSSLSSLPPLLRRRARHVVTENERVLSTVALLRDGAYREIGPLMTASHESLRDDYEVTVPELDVAVSAALSAGAYGARMTGGGFGGCVLALIPADAAPDVSAAVEAAFEERGFAAPSTFVAVPSSGAERISS